MKQNEHEELKIKVYGKYVEIEDKNGRVATARCNPVDKFDIYIGIKTALERLKEEYKKEKFKPYVCGDISYPHNPNLMYGYIGEPIQWKDEFDRVLKVGDTVQIKVKDDPNIYISTVFKTPVSDGVMGFPNIKRGQSPMGGYNREELVIVKLPRQKKTEWCTLIETYEEMKGK